MSHFTAFVINALILFGCYHFTTTRESFLIAAVISEMVLCFVTGAIIEGTKQR